MRRKTKEQQRLETKFMVAVEAFFREIGAKDNEGEWKGMYPLRLETEAGGLVIHVYETWVAMRFEDVEWAKNFVPHQFKDPWGMNPYSGKYNIHFGNDGVTDLDICLAQIESKIRPVRREGV